MALVKEMTIYLALISSLLCILNYSSTDAAIPLITVKEKCGYGEDQFVLNPEAISMMNSLSSPVKVIAAIGDARVGKSTALNFILWRQILGDVSMYGPEQGRKIELSEEEFEKVEKLRFKTGHTMEAETRGVWISFLTIPRGSVGLILLDVQGTDFGDDTVTDKLTMFATLMSSCLMLFMKENPTNHITDFVYKIARITDMTFSKEDTKYPPHLMVILRGALDPPQGYSTIDDYVKDSLTKPNFDDQLQEKRRVIRKRFSEEQITVFNLPYVCSPGIKSLRVNVCKNRTKFVKSRTQSKTGFGSYLVCG